MQKAAMQRAAMPRAAAPAEAQELTLVGACPADTYPLQKKRHSLEFLRTIAHLRPRSNLFGAVSRVRSALAQGTHSFFASEGFKYVQTPLITASDCEAAGGTGPLPRSSTPPHRPAWWSRGPGLLLPTPGRTTFELVPP